MKIVRKFNLAELGKQYESVEIELEGDTPADLIRRIDEVYQYYKDQIARGVVR